MSHRCRNGKAGDPEARRLLQQERAGSMDSYSQASRIRPLPAHASRQCRRFVPDVSRQRAEYDASRSAEYAQHGMVRELSRRPVEPSVQGALRLRRMPLLMSSETKPSAVKRREFLKVVGATGAATTMIGCSSERVEKLIPYLVSPDETVPGVSTYYATTCRECSAGCGVIAETRDGRAIKLEGNPDHPLSRGALCARGQAALQGW